MWRPLENWKKNPCENCPDKQEDKYGLLCDLACGKHTAYLNREVGADAMLEALFKLAKESPTGTFTIDSREYHIYEEK